MYIFNKGSKADKYMIQNLKWSGLYLRSTLLYDLLQKVLKLVSLIATGTEVYFTTMTTVLSDSYDSLVDTLNKIKILKLKDNLMENIANCCDSILVDAERLESAGTFYPEQLGYIICIFQDNSDSIFHIWATHKYEEVKEFIKKVCVCDKYVMRPDDIITYVSLVQ